MTQPSGAGRRRDRFIAGVTLAAIVVVACTGAAIDPERPFGPSNAAFAAVAGLLFVGEARPLRWYSRTANLDVTFTWSFAAALALLAPAGTALATLAAASAFGDLLARRAPSRILFNASQLVLSLGAGILVLDLAGERFALTLGQEVAWWWVFLAAAAGVVVLLVNGALVSGVIALDQGIEVGPVLRGYLIGDRDADGLLLALAPAYVVIAERSIPLLALLLGSSLVVHATAQLALARQHEADHDALTGLPVRRLLTERIGEVVAASHHDGQRGALLICDLDRFKDLNDRLGHAVGDQVLKEAARRLEALARESDLVARFGGDEFAMVAFPVPDRDGAAAIAARVSDALSAPVDVDGFPVAIQASVGAALVPDDGTSVRALLEHADVAMYEAKRHRSRSATYRPRGGGWGPMEILRDLPAALERDELQLRFQPIVALADGQVRGVEALLRWEHRSRGTINPLDFVPMAEQTELVQQVTQLVLHKALAAHREWRQAGHELLLAVNCSVRNLEDLGFPELVAASLERVGLAPHQLELEVTERGILTDVGRASVVLAELRSTGVRIAVDDFGTGFSSVGYLRELPVDRLKIDRSLIADLDGPLGSAIVGPICSLARNLGLVTVAEGVERPEVLPRLEALGCDEAQGYGIAPPLTAVALRDWLAARGVHA